MDGTETTQDVNTSEKSTETSEVKPDTFTEEQVVVRENKVRSDALADVGRLRKSSESAIKSAQAAEERISRMLKDQDDAELLVHKDEPEKLSAIRERQTRRDAESKLATAEQELEEEKAKTVEAQAVGAKHTKERNAREVASRLNVDAKILAELAIPTDGSVGAIEEKAKLLPKKGDAKTLKPDSSKTTAVSQMPESSGAKIKQGWDKIHPQG